MVQVRTRNVGGDLSSLPDEAFSKFKLDLAYAGWRT